MSILANNLTGNSPDGSAAPRRQLIISIVAVIVIVGSVSSLVLRRIHPGPRIDLAPFVGVGQAVAEQTAIALNNRGRVVVLQFAGQFYHDAMRKAFQAHLKKNGGIEVVAVETIKTDAQAEYSALTREQFEAVLKKHPAVAAIVSFAGLPPYRPDNPLALAAPAPKIIAYMDEPFPVRPYFTAGIVAAVIRPRQNIDQAATPKTPRDWFAMYYQVYDATNYQSLPD